MPDSPLPALLDRAGFLVLSCNQYSRGEGETVSQRSRIELHLNSRFFGAIAAFDGITLPFFGQCSR